MDSTRISNEQNFVRNGNNFKKIPNFQNLLGNCNISNLELNDDAVDETYRSAGTVFLSQFDSKKLSSAAFFTDSLLVTFITDSFVSNLRELPAEDTLTTPDGNALIEITQDELYGVPVYHVHMTYLLEVEDRTLTSAALNGLDAVLGTDQNSKAKKQNNSQVLATVKMDIHGYVTSQLKTLYQHIKKTFVFANDEGTAPSTFENEREVEWEIVSDPKDSSRMLLSESLPTNSDVEPKYSQLHIPADANVLSVSAEQVFKRLVATGHPFFRPLSAARPKQFKDASDSVLCFSLLQPTALVSSRQALPNGWETCTMLYKITPAASLNTGVPIVELSSTVFDGSEDPFATVPCSAVFLRDGQLVSSYIKSWNALCEAIDFKKGEPLYQIMEDARFGERVELLSEYSEIKNQLQLDFQQQLASNPESKHILADWLQAVLHHKPENVFEFTIQYFQSDAKTQFREEIAFSSPSHARPAIVESASAASSRANSLALGREQIHSGSGSRPVSATATGPGFGSSLNKLNSKASSGSLSSSQKLANFTPSKLINNSNNTSSTRLAREVLGSQNEAGAFKYSGIRRLNSGSAGSRRPASNPLANSGDNANGEEEA